MDFKDYQKESRKTAVYPNKGNDLTYPGLGIVNEAGEVAGKIKKVIRDQDGILNDENRKEIGKELGDVLWYIAQIATELGLDMDDIAQENIEKLTSRMDRGTLAGSGDNR